MSLTFLDRPGSIEFLQDTLFAVQGVDAAVVVVEPEPAKVQMLKPYLKRLADLRIPHFFLMSTRSTRRPGRCAIFSPCCRK